MNEQEIREYRDYQRQVWMGRITNFGLLAIKLFLVSSALALGVNQVRIVPAGQLQFWHFIPCLLLIALGNLGTALKTYQEERQAARLGELWSPKYRPIEDLHVGRLNLQDLSDKDIEVRKIDTNSDLGKAMAKIILDELQAEEERKQASSTPSNKHPE